MGKSTAGFYSEPLSVDLESALFGAVETAFWIVVAMCFGLTGLLALVFRELIGRYPSRPFYDRRWLRPAIDHRGPRPPEPRTSATATT